MRKPGKLEVTVPDTIRTLKTLKAVLTNAGYKYEELIKENQFDINNPSKLHQLCLLLSENITPARRIRALKAKGGTKNYRKKLSVKNLVARQACAKNIWLRQLKPLNVEKLMVISKHACLKKEKMLCLI